MQINGSSITCLFTNFDINKRVNITDKNYINKITKGVYELGSIFKTFTIALAIRKRFSVT